MKKMLFSLAMIAGMALSAQVVIFEDGFEDYDDFTIDNFGGWTQIDLDGGTTWGSEDVDFTNEGYVGAGIIWNASQTLPSSVGTNYDVYNGSKGLYFFASGASGTTYPNDDWAISPLISLEGATGSKLQLYAKALTDQYGPDIFTIGVSTTSANFWDFDFLSPQNITPSLVYELYEFDLSEYDGEEVVYIAINVTTDDGFILMFDDFKVIADELSVSEITSKNASAIYPNPVVDTFSLNLSSKFNANSVTVSVSDLTGKTVSTFAAATSYDISKLPAGVYVVKITDGKITETKKIVKK